VVQLSLLLPKNRVKALILLKKVNYLIFLLNKSKIAILHLEVAVEEELMMLSLILYNMDWSLKKIILSKVKNNHVNIMLQKLFSMLKLFTTYLLMIVTNLQLLLLNNLQLYVLMLQILRSLLIQVVLSLNVLPNMLIIVF